MNKIQTSEVINLQIGIISWLQKQFVQSSFNLSEVKDMVEVLSQATKSYETLFSLEERRLRNTDQYQSATSNPLAEVPLEFAPQASASPTMKTKGKKQGVRRKKQEELLDGQESDRTFIPALSSEDDADETDRVYYSLEQAHSDALNSGYELSQSVFRRELTEGAKLFGWRKADRPGNKPSYFKS